MQTLVLFFATAFLALYGWAGLHALASMAAEWWRPLPAGPHALAMAGPSRSGGGRPAKRSGDGLPAGKGLPGDIVDGFAEHLTAELRPLTKPWWQSRGVVGPIVAILAVAGGWLGVDVDASTQAYVIDQTIAAVSAAGVLVGAVMGIIGRLRAIRAIR